MVAGVEQRIPYAEPVVWIMLQGRGRIIYGPGDQSLAFERGETVLLPSALQDGRVALDEDAVWLEVTLPTPSDLAEFPRPERAALRDPETTSDTPVQIRITRPQ